jgi:hypothetical protein
MKRRDNALRQIERWRDGLGGKAQALSDKFIAEQALAERYGVDHFLADAEIEAMEAASPLAPAGEAADTVPTVPLSDGGVEAVPPLAPPGDSADTAPMVPLSDEAAEAVPRLAPAGEAADTAPTVSVPDEAAEAAPPLATAGDAADIAPTVSVPDEAVEAAPPLAPAGEAADAASTVPLLDETERINWVGWLTGAEKYEWVVLEVGARKKFKQVFPSKKALVRNLVVDCKVIPPDRVCPELAQYLPAIAEAAPTLTPSGEEPK